MSRFAPAAAAALMTAAPALAGVVAVGPSQDNTLYESVDGSLSSGAGDAFFAGRTAMGFLRRGLIAFDIAGAVPAGATINDVSLQLHVSNTIADERTISLHTLLASWGEGDSVAGGGGGGGGGGAPSSPGDATWIHRFFDTELWTNPGGDFDPLASAETLVGGVGFYSWSSATMTSDVQAWLDDPAANFGWLVQGDEATPFTTKRFDSREAEETFRPVLTIDFTPVPGPSALVLFGMTLLASRRRRAG